MQGFETYQNTVDFVPGRVVIFEFFNATSRIINIGKKQLSYDTYMEKF